MAARKTAVVIGVTADIGRGLAERLLGDGWNIIGIGRSMDRVRELRDCRAVSIYQCAITKKEDVESVASGLRAKAVEWDLLVSSVGTTEPIGRFFDLNFDEWEKSFNVNFLAQMRILHALWPLRRREQVVDIMLLAGGGTNSAWRNYSAYCASKIALIKMCELIDDEAPDANAFIIGPGYTRTRIHQETLRAGAEAAGENYFKVKAYLEREGTTIDEIYEHMRWCIAQGRSVSGGRNFSTVHDPWRGGGRELANILRDGRDAFRLRRCGTNNQ
jgi:NAD(P)-dependent dehydrogenase (short-subunit alcohol dehydrogenase family)